MWAEILTRVQALAGQLVWDVSGDSTIARAHQHAAGARRDATGRSSRPAGSRL